MSEGRTMLNGMTKWPLIALALVACSRRPAPVVELSDDAVPGLIDVELREKAALPGKLLDQDEVEDEIWGDAFSPEYEAEIEVEDVAATLAELRARKDV